MDFNYSPEDEAFRSEFRTWLDHNLQFAVPALGPLADEEEVGWEETLRWHRKLYEGGWLGITWPREYGGRGGTFLRLGDADHAPQARPRGQARLRDG